MNKKSNTNKILYVIIALVIIAGICVACTLKFNFTLMNLEHTRIDVNIGKGYNLEDIKQISKEVFGNVKMEFQKIETFNDSIAINVETASEEQITNLKDKIKEKYEIDDETETIAITQIPRISGKDMVKPYIIPVLIATVIIFAYTIIRYKKIGILKIVSELIIKNAVVQAIYVSLIAILRIPVGTYIIAISIGIYIATITYIMAKYQNEYEKIQAEEKNNI